MKLVKPAGAGHRRMFYLSFDETDGDASTSFVTKVEGYGEDGSLLWVATGSEPVKVKMRQ